MTGRLRDKSVLLTGAASGIGAATVALMLREGAKVLATDIDPVRGLALVDSLAPEAGGRIEFLRLDVAQESQWEHAIARLAARFGPLDVLVNNAGVAPQLVTLAQTSLEEWRRVMSINLDGTFLGVKHAIRAMTGRGGAIVNLSSVASRLGGLAGGAAYAASKGAIDSFTLALAKEVGLEGIRVNALRPGLIETDIHDVHGGVERMKGLAATAVPMGRSGSADEVAQAALWLASPAASYVHGAVIDVAGGR